MQLSYKLFKFQQFVNNLRLPYEQGKPMDTVKKLLDSVTDEINIEDLAFYKEYLSKFDIGKAIEGYELVTNPESKATKDDYLMLLRLICASFSTADFVVSFDEENHTVEFTIKVGTEERGFVKKLQEFQYLHILMLLEQYLAEQFRMEALRMDSKVDRDEIDLKRDVVVTYFETKMEKSRKHDSTCEIEGFANLND